MKFFKTKSVKSATIAILAAIVVSIVLANISNSSNISTDENQKLQAKTKTVILTDQTFEQTIKTGVTLVDFWAVWCGPCKMQGPIIDKVAEEMGVKAKICKLDTDKNPMMSSKYNVTMIPTILIFKNGKLVQKYIGVQQKEALVAKINELLK